MGGGTVPGTEVERGSLGGFTRNLALSSPIAAVVDIFHRTATLKEAGAFCFILCVLVLRSGGLYFLLKMRFYAVVEKRKVSSVFYKEKGTD